MVGFLFIILFFLGAIRAKLAATYGGEIIIKVSNNVLHQISSRVFGILAREVLNYDVKYEDIHYSQNVMQLNEKEKLFETLYELMYVCIHTFIICPISFALVTLIFL